LSLTMKGEFILTKKTDKNRSILIVAAHPDDEVLGCGGTMAACSKKGDDVYLLILGEGITSRDKKRDREKRDRQIKELKKQVRAAGKTLGVKKTFIFDFPDNRFDTVPLLDIIKTIEKIKKEVRPDVVYTHHDGDLNIDHQITFRAVMTAFRPLKNEQVKEIYSFEVPSSTEWGMDTSSCFRPDCFMNIKGTINKKIKALKAYSGEIRDFPHPRSAEAVEILARYRGVNVGLEYAEALKVVRQVFK